jgi:uncharacterized protein (DUF433 family)
MSAAIVNNRIAGTRITVWDVVHYLEAGRSADYIAEILPVSVEQMEAAIRYIEANKDEVMAVHRQIEERIARGNPPRIEALRAASRAKMDAWIKERHRLKSQSQEGNGEGTTHGR